MWRCSIWDVVQLWEGILGFSFTEKPVILQNSHAQNNPPQVPSSRLKSSQCYNVVTITAIFCSSLTLLIVQRLNIFRKQTHTELIFSFNPAFWRKKILWWFFEDMIYFTFDDDINFANFKISYYKVKQGANLKISYTHGKFI